MVISREVVPNNHLSMTTPLITHWNRKYEIDEVQLHILNLN